MEDFVGVRTMRLMVRAAPVLLTKSVIGLADSMFVHSWLRGSRLLVFTLGLQVDIAKKLMHAL